MSEVEDEVCELIQARAKVGKAKYGVSMERGDLTHDEWLEHLQNEMLDAVVYIQRLRTREQTLEAKLRKMIQTYRAAADRAGTAQFAAGYVGIVNELTELLDGVSE